MPIFTFDKYLSILPDDTKSYVKRLLNYLYDSDRIEFSRFNIIGYLDKLFYKSLKAFKEENERNRNTLQLLSFDESNYLSNSNIGSDTASKLFTEYYNAFVPFENLEDYLLIIPEDIIKNIHDSLMGNDKGYRTYNLIGIDDGEFIRRLSKMGEAKKIELLDNYSNYFNKQLRISSINYFNMVGKVYIYLRANKDKIKNIETSKNNLKNLAMLIAIFYYNHVSSYKDNYDEKQIIVNYLNSKGLTIEKITNAIGLNVPIEELTSINPTLVLYNEFFNIKPNNTPRENITVGGLVSTLINSGYENSIVIKQILGLCNLTISEVSKIETVLKEQKEEINNNSLEELYKDLMPNVISYLKRVASIYTYLFNKKDTLEKSIVESRQDLITLAFLLSSYEFKNVYHEFFTDKGLTIEKVLELVKLPPKEQYQKEVSQVTPAEKEIARFSKLITEGVNSKISKDSITVESIIKNTTSKDRTNSSVYQKLYKLVTGENLDNTFYPQIEKHLKSKEDKAKRELTEEVLKDIQIDVFNFLKMLCNYYSCLSNKGLDQVDLEQLSIILAASRYDSEIEKYLDSFGMTRNELAKAFKIDYNYQEKGFDIYIILNHFVQYIFDRKNEEITVYSIFENAFKPELTNTLNLRKVLFKFGRQPEDFLDIDKSIEEQKRKKVQLEENEKINSLLSHCTDDTKSIFQEVLKVYEFLSSSKIKSDLIKDKNDIKEAALLIAILDADHVYIPFFSRNGITLESVLEALEIDFKELEELKLKEVNKKNVLEFKEYLMQYNFIHLEQLIFFLIGNSVNNSQLLEEITRRTGNNYEYLVEEVENKKERDITPDQGIQLLTASKVEDIEDSSLGNIAEYGLGVSKHSKYINSALQELITSDSLDHSIENINTLLSEVSYEETIPAQTPTQKKSFWSRLLEIPSEPQLPQVVRKYDISKIGGIEDHVDTQIQLLTSELRRYEFIKKYIEAYLKKLSEYLKSLKTYYKQIEDYTPDEELDEIELFTKTLDQNSSREIILDKINTFETMILLMKQELVTVHHSIINHFITINALQTSKSAILPLIATEVALGVGKKNEEEALTLTSDLINLFQSVVNKNITETKLNLEKLRLSSLSSEAYSEMSREINSYLESLNRSNTVLEQKEQQALPEVDEQHKSKK